MKDALTGGGSDFVEVNGERKHVIGYMKEFLFGPEQARTPIGRLSGGERGRLMLAQGLGAGPPISSFSTSRPMISISKRSIFCRKCSATTRDPADRQP